jgi:putative sigma-54 modulation protein
MRLVIRCKNVKVTEAIREKVRLRVGTALRRFDQRIRDVAASLVDVNGPKGGVDKQCCLVVRLHHKGKIMVKETGSSEFAAITLAAARIKRAVTRALQRRNDAKIDRDGFSPKMRAG